MLSNPLRSIRLSFTIISIILARYQSFETVIARSIARGNCQFRRVVILTNSRNIAMSRTMKEKAVENEEMELNAKKIMKFLLDHEVHLPSTYDSERKIINLCVKNLVRIFAIIQSPIHQTTIQKANDLDVEQTKSTLLERYKEPREKKKSGRKRVGDTILGGLVKKRRKKRATSTPKIEIVRNEANRPIVEMINEMSERYFVSGDQNRGGKCA